MVDAIAASAVIVAHSWLFVFMVVGGRGERGPRRRVYIQGYEYERAASYSLKFPTHFNSSFFLEYLRDNIAELLTK